MASLGRWNAVDSLAEDVMQIDKSPYQYAWNNPVYYTDPDGRCPWCLGAIVGAVIDYGSQVTVNLVRGKSLGDALTDINGTSIVVSAAAGATGVGVAQGIKNFGKVAAVATEVVSDAAISATGQAINDGEVDLKNIVVDAAIGQGARRSVGKVVKGKALDSDKGKALQRTVNQEKNIARGKSRQQGVKKSDANVEGAQNDLGNFAAGKAAVGSGAVAGSTRKAVNTVMNNKDDKR